MTFSPTLEARFEKLLNSYPPGRQRSAVVPMLLYGQDEVGSVTRELVEEVAKRCGVVTTLQVDEVIGYYSMLHKQAAGHSITSRFALTSPARRWVAKNYMHMPEKSLGCGNKQVIVGRFDFPGEVECMGACSWAPAIQVNYDFFHNVTSGQRFDQLMAALREGTYGRQAS